MSTNELIPLFPSATHPAIPIASQILSTLRNLTAPGKGNDMRPEERAALVGVSALLGCEKVQSRDLVESSAQKASSVSPAYFRSALQHARRLLKTQPAQSRTSTSPSTRRSSRSSPHAPDGGPLIDPLSPFSTPKKRFKYSSGVDLSGLVRGGIHSPAQSSPLKNSVTPSRLAEQDQEEREGDERDVRTPTKRAKYGLKQGVDLEKEVDKIPDIQTERPLRSGSKRGESSTAFFSLRDGGASGDGPGSGQEGNSKVVDFGGGEFNAQRRREDKGTAKKDKEKRDKRRRRDWTYGEIVWSSDEVKRTNQAALHKIWSDLPAWIDTHQITLPEPSLSTFSDLLGEPIAQEEG